MPQTILEKKKKIQVCCQSAIFFFFERLFFFFLTVFFVCGKILLDEMQVCVTMSARVAIFEENFNVRFFLEAV